MNTAFLNKVKQTILDHLEDEKFSINDLASEIGFSKSQIWRKVKASTGKTTNEFIREIRLNEAAKLIEQDQYTASEIAYRVGFNSPSYFNKCFHDHFGVTPGDYKELKEETSEIEDTTQETKNISQSRFLKIALASIFIIAIGTLGYLLVDKPESKHTSIVVLPFLDLSENKDHDYLVDGITEQITLELSKRNDLRVISRTSAMRYKDENKLSSDIAKELGVEYLLEGSVFHGTDSIRVNVQLIEPLPKEKNIWQNSYTQKLESILNLVKGISTEIAEEINIDVAPEVAKQVEYAINPKALELYLKGRYLWNQKNLKSVKKSIEYLEESIKLDSNYAPTYVILAEDYILMNKFIRNNEEKLIHRNKSRKAINKALELDNNLADAYITKGNIIGKFDWEWDDMKKMLTKGLQIDPNNSYGHMLLSKYYIINNDYDQAIEESLLAEKLDPLNPRNACFVAENYFLAGDYKRSLKQYEKVFEMFPNYAFAWEGVGHVQFFLKQKETAKTSWGKFLKAMGNDYMADLYSNESFENSINLWLKGATKGEELYCSNPPVIAQAHMFVDKKEKALKYLEIAYKYRNEDLPIFLLGPHFYKLYNKPRFKDLVKNTGVILPDIKIEYEIK
ncbi:MAG: helix-turn-helix domain-containing protein, partial [Flavobacteriaceae bacterium]|nr:helix-turn-helix domain-containing protein [Flavobacteriaceae bacterium]